MYLHEIEVGLYFYLGLSISVCMCVHIYVCVSVCVYMCVFVSVGVRVSVCQCFPDRGLYFVIYTIMLSIHISGKQNFIRKRNRYCTLRFQ